MTTLAGIGCVSADTDDDGPTPPSDVNVEVEDRSPGAVVSPPSTTVVTPPPVVTPPAGESKTDVDIDVKSDTTPPGDTTTSSSSTTTTTTTGP